MSVRVRTWAGGEEEQRADGEEPHVPLTAAPGAHTTRASSPRASALLCAGRDARARLRGVGPRDQRVPLVVVVVVMQHIRMCQAPVKKALKVLKYNTFLKEMSRKHHVLPPTSIEPNKRWIFICFINGSILQKLDHKLTVKTLNSSNSNQSFSYLGAENDSLMLQFYLSALPSAEYMKSIKEALRFCNKMYIWCERKESQRSSTEGPGCEEEVFV